jgi:hypothetical protein
MRTQVFAYGLIPLLGMSWAAFSVATTQSGEPIHLSLTFIQSNPVTTITVGERVVQAIVDTGGDAAVTLSKEVLDSAGAVSSGDTVFSADYLGIQHIRPRFRVPVVKIGGRTFHNMDVVQAPVGAPGSGPPVPNGIGREFLSKYFAVLDYAGRTITLYAPYTKNAPGLNCGRTQIRMEHTVEDGLAVSDFDTQSGRVRLLWDTGASISMLPEMTAEKLRLVSTARGNARFWQAKSLSAAGHDFGPVEFVIAPAKLPADFEGMLGQNFFEHHVVCLDYKGREVRVR